MNKTHVLKNQKDSKMKKIHMKSIMSEVKNKNIIEDLENMRKCNESEILNYKPNWKDWEMPRPSKKSSNTGRVNAKEKGEETANIGQNKENQGEREQKETIHRQPSLQIQLGSGEHEEEVSSTRKKFGLKRKSSRIELQLK